MKKITLSPKDTNSKLILTNVDSFYQEGRTLVIVFHDGRIRNYPLEHLWYYESGESEPNDKQIING